MLSPSAAVPHALLLVKLAQCNAVLTRHAVVAVLVLYHLVILVSILIHIIIGLWWVVVEMGLVVGVGKGECQEKARRAKKGSYQWVSHSIFVLDSIQLAQNADQFVESRQIARNLG